MWSFPIEADSLCHGIDILENKEGPIFGPLLQVTASMKKEWILNPKKRVRGQVLLQLFRSDNKRIRTSLNLFRPNLGLNKAVFALIIIRTHTMEMFNIWEILWARCFQGREETSSALYETVGNHYFFMTLCGRTLIFIY